MRGTNISSCVLSTLRCTQIPPPPPTTHFPFTTTTPQEGKGRVLGALVAGSAVAGGVAICSADHVPSIDYGWNHHGLLASYDYPR